MVKNGGEKGKEICERERGFFFFFFYRRRMIERIVNNNSSLLGDTFNYCSNLISNSII